MQKIEDLHEMSGAGRKNTCRSYKLREVQKKKALELKNRREAWEAMGLCKVCGGQKPKDRYLLCPACREKARGYKKERSEEYAEFLEWKKSRSQLAE